MTSETLIRYNTKWTEGQVFFNSRLCFLYKHPTIVPCSAFLSEKIIVLSDFSILKNQTGYQIVLVFSYVYSEWLGGIFDCLHPFPQPLPEMLPPQKLVHPVGGRRAPRAF
jgi:hypothetical protein